MKLKCDICGQEELVPDTFISPDPLIPDREITGGMRHSDWTICLKILLLENSKLGAQVEQFKDCLEYVKANLEHSVNCAKVLMVGKPKECDCGIEVLEEEINSLLGKVGELNGRRQ